MLKKEVLRNRNDFSRIYRRGRSVGERYVVLFFMKNGLEYNRTAFLASKKVGNSVQRNRARRVLRECWKKHQDILPAGYDFIIIARNTINGRKCQQVQESLDSAVRKAKITKPVR
ncbi:MAG: ribonuclease P protein component [Firmicutes bacterium]|nr:ribonuclease P protein component [Bacillota bacterium]